VVLSHRDSFTLTFHLSTLNAVKEKDKKQREKPRKKRMNKSNKG
jgi:hypothetical protein